MKPIHLAIDAVGTKHTGGATVLLDLLEAAIDDPRLSGITVFCSPRSDRSFDLPESRKLVVADQKTASRSYPRRILWYQRTLGRVARASGADVLFCFNGAGMTPPGLPHVNLVHQPLPYSPEAMALMPFRVRARMAMIRRLTHRSCASSQKVIVQISAMQSRLATAFSLPEGLIQVIPPGPRLYSPPEHPSPRVAIMRAAPESCRLLYVGNAVDRYKNVHILLRALPLLRAQIPEFTLYLAGPAPEQEIEGVVRLGYLDGPSLREAYELATALVMPSLTESYGMPLVEAMAYGTPIAVADRPYGRDVCEDAAVFFDPHDPVDLSRKLVALISDGGLREKLRSRGKNLARKRLEDEPYRRMVSVAVDAVQTAAPGLVP